jgi:drug/metabolite transporter (DMT)-like permease
MYIVLFIQQLIAASTHVVSKSLTDTIDPSVLLLFRALIASIIFMVILFFKRKRLPKLEKKDFLTFIILGILCIPLNQYLFFISIGMTTPANVALAYALCPAFVLVMEIIYLKTKSSKFKIAGIFIAFTGAFIIFLERGIDFSSSYFLGNLIALTAAFAWAIYTIIGKTVIYKYGATYSTGLAIIIGYICYLPIYAIWGDTSTISKIEPFDWIKIAYLGAFTSVIGYGLWYWVLKKLDASKLSVTNNLQPILTTILSVIFLTQTFTVSFIVGGIIAITGVILTQRA